MAVVHFGRILVIHDTITILESSKSPQSPFEKGDWGGFPLKIALPTVFSFRFKAQ